MSSRKEVDYVRYSVSLVTQGKHRFYTLTLPSEVLARCCFVSNRIEDPLEGFQRLLDEKRAREIAQYIDHGHGTIPNSIVLSAQASADMRVVGRGKTIEFRPVEKAFLIIDGQHRVYGFRLAKTNLRVPVVIYNGLERRDESRLFIDINTKQRPVPNELLLDIKKLAEYEDQTEVLLGNVFDLFGSDARSPLLGLMSPSERRRGKVSRVTFNSAIKPLIGSFDGSDPDRIYQALSAYVQAFLIGCRNLEADHQITNPTLFRAAMMLFAEVAQRVQDRHGSSYTVANFDSVLSPMFAKLSPHVLKRPGRSPKELYSSLSQNFRQQFTL